jgi:hypothetical protein
VLSRVQATVATWTITGIRSHRVVDDFGSEFASVSEVLNIVAR